MINFDQNCPKPSYIYKLHMSTGTVLCIHRDPAQLSVLTEHGYELATATTGSDGLRLFMSQPVDAVVLEYHLGLMDGATVAAEIKRVRPDLPIVMVADHVELPVDALESVDALVVNSDGPHFLLATVHFVLNVKPAQRQSKLRPAASTHLRRTGKSRELVDQGGGSNPQSATETMAAPFSREVWRSIRDGVLKF
jgi:DNA-binding response OmpR family regulator